MYVEDGNEFYKTCSCGLHNKRIMVNRLEFANIPKAFSEYRLKTFTFSAYQNPESKSVISQACKIVKMWLDDLDNMMSEGVGLYLFSKAKGSGKTRMAASIGNELIENHNLVVKFATSTAIIQEIKNTWHGNEEKESDLLRKLATVDVLIIDDFGTEEVKDWIGERFYQIINERYSNKKVTLFTSNEPINDLQYDERVTNRIKEMCFLVKFPEESIRENIAKSKAELLKEKLGGVQNGKE